MPEATTQSPVNKVRASLHRILTKLGHANGNICPPGDNHDPVLHELFVTSECEAYFKRRRQAALESVHAHVCEVFEDDEIAALEPGTEEVLLEGKHYVLMVKKNMPSARINKTQVENEFAKLMPLQEVAKVMERCTTATKPAVTIKAISR